MEHLSSEERTRKHLAQMLRKRLQGRVPGHILAALTDDELCESYQEHNAVQLRIAHERATKQDDSKRIHYY